MVFQKQIDGTWKQVALYRTLPSDQDLTDVYGTWMTQPLDSDLIN